MEIKREDLFRYIYHTEGEMVAVLDKDKLKEILGVDEVILEEVYN